jgi:hypothetical protein
MTITNYSDSIKLKIINRNECYREIKIQIIIKLQSLAQYNRTIYIQSKHGIHSNFCDRDWESRKQ